MDQGQTDYLTMQSKLIGDERTAWVKLLLGPQVDGAKPVWSALVIVGPRPEG